MIWYVDLRSRLCLANLERSLHIPPHAGLRFGQPPAHPEARPSRSVNQPATSNLLTLFLYCHGNPSVLAKRIAARKGHFMGAQMLESQLATLQDPRDEKGVTSVEIDQPEEEVAREAVRNVKMLVKGEVEHLD